MAMYKIYTLNGIISLDDGNLIAGQVGALDDDLVKAIRDAVDIENSATAPSSISKSPGWSQIDPIP